MSPNDQVKPLKPELAALLKEFTDWWDAVGRELDIANAVTKPLHHYTDMGSLKGILDNEELWFTSILHMNDPTELGTGLGVATGVLSELGNGEGAERLFSDLSIHVLEDGSKKLGFYVGSFSRKENDLGQWRAYGDNGRGVSIAFAPEFFRLQDPANLKINEKTIITNVVYGDGRDKFREAIDRALRLAVRAVPLATPDEGREFSTQLASELAIPIFTYSLAYKHEAYEPEQEVRLLVMGALVRLAPILASRTRGSRLIPFVKSPLPLPLVDAIKGIVIGPAADARAIDAVRSLLRHHGLSPDIVTVSGIPYIAH